MLKKIFTINLLKILIISITVAFLFSRTLYPTLYYSGEYTGSIVSEAEDYSFSDVKSKVIIKRESPLTGGFIANVSLGENQQISAPLLNLFGMLLFIYEKEQNFSSQGCSIILVTGIFNKKSFMSYSLDLTVLETCDGQPKKTFYTGPVRRIIGKNDPLIVLDFDLN